MNVENLELRLYIIEKLPANVDLVNNLRTILENRFNQRFKLEVIDIMKNPEKTIADEILASPTLIRVRPLPPKRIVGAILRKNLVEELEIIDHA